MNDSNIIKIVNFKNIEELEIELKPLTFLFGPNGSGKSSFIKAIKFFEKNLLPTINNRTVYKVNEYINLGNYREIVQSGDTEKHISIEFKHNVPDEESDLKIDVAKWKSHPGIWSKFNYWTQIEEMEEILIEHYVLTERNGLIKTIIYSKDDNEGYEIPSRFSFSIRLTFSDSKTGKNLHCIEIIDKSSESQLKIFPNETKSVNEKNVKGFGFAFVEEYGIRSEFKIFNDESIDELFMDFYEWIYILPFIEYDETDLNDIDPADKYRKSPEINLYYDRIRRLFIKYVLERLKGNPEWEMYSLDDKKRIIFKAVQFFRRFYVEIPKEISKLLLSSHIPTTREIPKHSYILSDGDFDNNDYYGFLSKLTVDRFDYGIELNHSVDHIIQFLQFGQGIKVEKTSELGKIYLLPEGGGKCNLAEASSGLLQVLPIIIESLLCGWNGSKFSCERREWGLVIIEQPELHLHPKLQTSLARFFADEVANDFLIETHSEHIIKQIQVLIATGELNQNRVRVYYFDNSSGKTEIVPMELEDNGFFKNPWPNGFFDDNYNLTKDLLFASRN